MTAYTLTPRARADLAEIWDYTARTWGRAQADRYVRELDGAFQGIADGQVVSRSADDIRDGYRKVAVRSHTVFFRVIAGTVEIVRVLHQRMDAGAVLR